MIQKGYDGSSSGYRLVAYGVRMVYMEGTVRGPSFANKANGLVLWPCWVALHTSSLTLYFSPTCIKLYQHITHDVTETVYKPGIRRLPEPTRSQM